MADDCKCDLRDGHPGKCEWWCSFAMKLTLHRPEDCPYGKRHQ